MINPVFPAAALMLLLAAPAEPHPQPVRDAEAAQERIRQHVVIRIGRSMNAVRAGAPFASVVPRPTMWVERKAKKCVKLDRIAAAAVTRSDAIDFLLRDGGRLRARLGRDCPALGFYSGIYVKPREDGEICAERDSVRSRSGRVCQLQTFSALVPIR